MVLTLLVLILEQNQILHGFVLRCKYNERDISKFNRSLVHQQQNHNVTIGGVDLDISFFQLRP